MNIIRRVLIQSLVKTFYRQHAGLLAFVLFMMLVAVGRANEAGLLEYHYALILGMMTNPLIFMLVLLAWLLYAKKCEQFISARLARTDYSFLHVLRLMKPRRIYRWLLLVQVLIYLPVLWYVLIIVGVGIHGPWYSAVALVLLFNLLICLLSARWYLFLLQNPGKRFFRLPLKIPALLPEGLYWPMLIRYILARRKLFFLALKLFDCGLLYLMVSRQAPESGDLGMIILFYSFGLLGHGAVMHDLRELEETRLSFYRGLAVSLPARFLQYAVLYFVLFIPEVLSIIALTPRWLRPEDGFLLVFFGYGLLLLLNSLLFHRPWGKKTYMKILVCLFFLIFLAVLSRHLVLLTLIFFPTAVALFFRGYYRYERAG